MTPARSNESPPQNTSRTKTGQLIKTVFDCVAKEYKLGKKESPLRKALELYNNCKLNETGQFHLMR